MHVEDTIYVAGHRGLVGSALVRRLHALGYENILTAPRADLELTDQGAVKAWFDANRIDYVFLAAARVGGIHANSVYRAEFIRENLAIQTNVIHAAYQHGVKRLMYLGSSCIYPRDCPQPMREEHILTGPLEQTNLPYAIAKIAGLKMVEAYNFQYATEYVSLMPTNLYGIKDNFDLESSHVVPAMIRKLHEGRGRNSVKMWGTGNPKREFLLVDDLAGAMVTVARSAHKYDVLNVGSSEEVTISELAHIIAEIVGYTGRIEFDPSMPDGTPQKLLDSTRIRELGWTPETDLRTGIRATYAWYLEHQDNRAA